MKVELDKDGLLSIKAETELESYALGKWVKDNPNNEKILLQWGLEENESNNNCKKIENDITSNI